MADQLSELSQGLRSYERRRRERACSARALHHSGEITGASVTQIDEMTNDLSGFSFRNEDMRNSRDRVNKAARILNPMAGERMVAHCQISPKANPQANERMMMENKQRYDTRGWKCYLPTEGGWFLHENDAFIKTAIELEEPLECVHKGFPFLVGAACTPIPCRT